ncbi:thiol reductant ABC exporter subunit CydD [uncultured Actinomyces sp.]|uniref:thiol reductant ABC exporter subunit CydD n=1 Tax=uncultured Actinomyces sp. TaxID=249061 RepID=UPI00261305C9|nr:thiol reductant ABC exporter subunit CydD [uncultured Actinomyces sp.]
MKPLDKRLLTYAAAAKRYIIFITIFGTLTAVLVLAQAISISSAISPVISEGKSLADVYPWVITLLVIVSVRAGLLYLLNSRAHRAANDAIIELREQVLDHVTKLGPRWLARKGTDTITLITRGLDDLGPYFVSYLPQLLMTMTVTPVALAVMLYYDFLSAIIAILTIPLIPIFMILIGKLTQEYSDQKLKTMERLGSQLLDLIAGLATLKALGRENAPNKHVHELGQTHAKTSMQTLRVAFLSGAILEFIATLSVALVAVEVGMRLVYGNISLYAGLIVIMLAPEVYLPLREVGKQFHNSADGVAAANAAFEILEEPVQATGTVKAPNLTHESVQFADLNVAARGAWAPAGLNATIQTGKITALVGPSGAGKTTTVMVLLGLLKPTRGRVLVGGTDLADIEPSSWWQQHTWVPQAPAILPGTIHENVTFGLDVSQDKLEDAARATGFLEVVEQLPTGWETPVGQGGIGLSVGQRQRLALTRALLEQTPWVILDEPTAHLDALTESQVIDTMVRLRDMGRTVIVIAHRKAVIDAADAILEVRARPATKQEIQDYPQLAEKTVEQFFLTEQPRLLEETR